MNINPTLIKKYAELIVKTGANVQKGQIVELSSSIENAYFAEIVMEECYKAGAKFVMVNWINKKASVLTYKYAELEELKNTSSDGKIYVAKIDNNEYRFVIGKNTEKMYTPKLITSDFKTNFDLKKER